MQAQTNALLHNRFDIQVKDALTGDIIQEGQAENIILDRMYDRVCTFSTYFVNIVFGSGSGIPTPERNTLFNRVGSKAASTVETIKDFPVSKWTRKIVLGTTEFNGNTITEVGISDSTTNINTHAMITDAEGNPLSIEKTDLVIIDIYATIYISLSNKQDNIYFVGLPNNNSLLNYLTGDSAPANSIDLQNNNSYKGGGFTLSTHSGSRVRDGRTVRLTASISETSGNSPAKMIDAIEWLNCYRIDLPDSEVFQGHQFYDMQLGVGDGVQTAFPSEHSLFQGIIVRVDGDIQNVYMLNNGLQPYFPAYHPSFFGEILSDIRSGFLNILSAGSTEIIIERSKSLIGCKMAIRTNAGISARHIYIDGSNDLENWVDNLVPRASGSATGTGISDPFPVSVDTYRYIRFRLAVASYAAAGYIIPAESDNMLIFDVPPQEGNIITADYFVPYIPKDENYKLNITMEIIFGEGV